MYLFDLFVYFSFLVYFSCLVFFAFKYEVQNFVLKNFVLKNKEPFQITPNDIDAKGLTTLIKITSLFKNPVLKWSLLLLVSIAPLYKRAARKMFLASVFNLDASSGVFRYDISFYDFDYNDLLKVILLIHDCEDYSMKIKKLTSKKTSKILVYELQRSLLSQDNFYLHTHTDVNIIEIVNLLLNLNGGRNG